MKKIFLGVALLTLTIFTCGAQTKSQLRRAEKERQAIQTQQKMDSLLQKKTFKFIPNRAVTSLRNNPYVTLTSLYTVEIMPDSINCQLPFYGNAYTSFTGSSSPLNFSSNKFTYKELPADNRNKKNPKTLLIIEARSTTGTLYTLTFEVFNNATAALNISSNTTSNMLFLGQIE